MISDLKARRYWPAISGSLLIAAYCGLCLFVCYLGELTGIAFSTCPLKITTGLPCPFCGGTHAALALLQGNLRGAFLLNPLAAGFFLLGPPVAASYYLLLQNKRGKIRMPRLLWALFAAAILANWAYLISAGR